MSIKKHAFDVATEADNEVNKLLAETDGKVAVMEYDGTIGYHIHVAKGETEPEYLWKVALLQALDETIFERIYVDETEIGAARRQVERELRQSLGADTAMRVGDVFEQKLGALVQTQREHATDAAVGGD